MKNQAAIIGVVLLLAAALLAYFLFFKKKTGVAPDGTVTVAGTPVTGTYTADDKAAFQQLVSQFNNGIGVSDTPNWVLVDFQKNLQANNIYADYLVNGKVTLTGAFLATVSAEYINDAHDSDATYWPGGAAKANATRDAMYATFYSFKNKAILAAL